MKNSEAGIALCGVVVGVLLGAGSILYAQGSSLGADARQTEHAAATQDCGVATAVVKELSSTALYVIPNDNKNTQRRAEIKKSADGIVGRYCPPAAPMKQASATKKVSAPVDVDNECEEFEYGSTRYLKCMGAEEKNKAYWGQQ